MTPWGMGCWIETQCCGLKLEVKFLCGFLLRCGNCDIKHRTVEASCHL